MLQKSASLVYLLESSWRRLGTGTLECSQENGSATLSGKLKESASLSSQPVSGDESASRRPESLQRAGALGDWRLLRAADVDAESGEVGAGGEDKVVGKWRGEWRRESKDMTQDEPKMRTLFRLSQTKCAQHALWWMFEKSACVCVHLGGHSVYTPVALTAVATGWVRNPVSAASVEELSTKKTTQDDCQNSLFSMSLKFLMKPLRPVAWCFKWLPNSNCHRSLWFDLFHPDYSANGDIALDLCRDPAHSCLVLKANSMAHFKFVPLLPIISPLIVLPIALVPWVPILNPRWWVPPAWARSVPVDEEDDGWSVKVCFSSEKYSAQFVLRPLKEPFCIRRKLIIQSLPGTWWDEFDSHIFLPLLLHTF